LFEVSSVAVSTSINGGVSALSTQKQHCYVLADHHL
jgi:hypothetical protein